MSRRRESFQPSTSPSADELLASCYGTRVYRAPAVLTVESDIAGTVEGAESSFWSAVWLALVVEIVGMLAITAAAWRVLGSVN